MVVVWQWFHFGLRRLFSAQLTFCFVSYLGLSTGTRASGYPLSNGYPGSKISARVGRVGPPVVINTSRLAKISAAMKSCTPRVVVALLSATEASHLSGRQGADEAGELGGYVD